MSFEQFSKDSAGTVVTQWETRTYDVWGWGNGRDGYDINDVYPGPTVELEIPLTVNNMGTAQEFVSAFPTDSQIKESLGIADETKIEIDGDDVSILVCRFSDGYPLGELVCLSHESLSPVRKGGK
jgi:hypothetical protein